MQTHKATNQFSKIITTGKTRLSRLCVGRLVANTSPTVLDDCTGNSGVQLAVLSGSPNYPNERSYSALSAGANIVRSLGSSLY